MDFVWELVIIQLLMCVFMWWFLINQRKEHLRHESMMKEIKDQNDVLKQDIAKQIKFLREMSKGE